MTSDLRHALHEEAIAEGLDGYLDPETGFWVFTSAYHLARGYCCGSGCRHCPFTQEEAL